jgi:hypothetical protein
MREYINDMLTRVKPEKPKRFHKDYDPNPRSELANIMLHNANTLTLNAVNATRNEADSNKIEFIP